VVTEHRGNLAVVRFSTQWERDWCVKRSRHEPMKRYTVPLTAEGELFATRQWINGRHATLEEVKATLLRLQVETPIGRMATGERIGTAHGNLKPGNALVACEKYVFLVDFRPAWADLLSVDLNALEKWL
jgi:hypothetical protein